MTKKHSAPRVGLGARPCVVRVDCANKLAPYARLFPQGKDVSSLDQVERRFGWFRRLQETLDGKFDTVFPQHWRVQHRVCVLFLEVRGPSWTAEAVAPFRDSSRSVTMLGFP